MFAGTQAEYQSDAGSTKNTWYLALMWEIWFVFCEYFWEDWLRYNSTTLCIANNAAEQRRLTARNYDRIIAFPDWCTFQVLAIFTRGQFWPSGIVVACVCLCVCVSVNHELVRAIIHQPFKLGSPNLDQRCKRPIVLWGDWQWSSRSNWAWKSKFTPFWACEFVRAISQNQIKWGFPNLDQKCITALFRSLLILRLIDLDLQFHF